MKPLLLLLALVAYVKGQGGAIVGPEDCYVPPCQNGGNGAVTQYTCQCTNGYTGTYCEVPPVEPTAPSGGLGETTWIPTLPPCEFPVPVRNVAQGKPVTQSSTNTRQKGFVEKAVDGNNNSDMRAGKSCTQTMNEYEPYFTLDLGQSYDIYEVVIYNRVDCCMGRIKSAIVRVGADTNFKSNPQCGRQIMGRLARINPIRVRCGCPIPMQGRHVSIQLTDVSKPLNLCEVEVMVG